MKKLSLRALCALLALCLTTACSSTPQKADDSSQNPPPKEEAPADEPEETPEEEAVPEEEAAPEEPENPQLKVGETYRADGFCELTIHKIVFTYDVLPDNQDILYTHYPADEGKIYLDIDIDVKNLQKEDLSCDEAVSFTLDYNDGYTYRAFPVVEDSSTGFTYARISFIDPLETKAMRYLVDCPLEVYTDPRPLFLTVSIGTAELVIPLREEGGAYTESLSLNEASFTEAQQAAIEETLSSLDIEAQWIENAPPISYETPDSAQEQKSTLDAIMENLQKYYVHTADGKLYILSFHSDYNLVVSVSDATDPDAKPEQIFNNIDELVDRYVAATTPTSSQPRQRRPVDMSQEELVSFVDISDEDYQAPEYPWADLPAGLLPAP